MFYEKILTKLLLKDRFCNTEPLNQYLGNQNFWSKSCSVWRCI